MVEQDSFAAVAELEGVPSALAAARDAIDAVLRDRGLRRTGPDLTAESLLRGARASAQLEEADEVEAGVIRLSTELLGLVPVWRRAPLQALARMHTLAARGAVDDARLGRPVRGAGRLAELASRLTAPTEGPALAVAAVVHAEIAAVGAFPGYDGVLARAAERLVLVERGVDPASVTTPEAGHLALRSAYAGSLERYRQGAPDAVRRWLLHCADAYPKGAELSPLVHPAEPAE
ncbi:MAG: oxidoreductase [Propionibacteriales bacterium]|nr:oxidoreductase [Propionibacteriales bacterium]